MFDDDFLRIFVALITIAWTFVVVAKILDEVFGSGSFAKKMASQFAEMQVTPYFTKAYINSLYLPDLIYGVRVFSVRALLFSFLIAVFWFLIQCVFAIFLDGKNAWLFNSVFSPFVVKRFWYLIFIGAVIDFISLCVTRWLLRYAVNRSSWIQLAILLLDAFLSVAIFFVLFSMAKHFIVGSLTGVSIFSYESIKIWFSLPFNLHMINVLMNDAYIIPLNDGTFRLENFNTEIVYAFPEGMIFISSLITSVWIWLIIITQKLYGVAFKINRFKGWMVKQSNIESKPILSVTLLVFILVFVPVIIILWGIWIFRSIF